MPGGERQMMGFETITLAPIDLDLVEPKLLTDGERDWLNAYHVRVREGVVAARRQRDESLARQRNAGGLTCGGATWCLQGMCRG